MDKVSLYFGVIARLFRQIGGHSSKFVLYLKTFHYKNDWKCNSLCFFFEKQ